MKRPLPMHMLMKPVKVYGYTLAHCEGVLWFSVLHRGVVQGHAMLVVLEDVLFRVNVTGEAKARRLRKKNPYALVCGVLTAVATELPELDTSGAMPVKFYRNDWDGGFFGDARTGDRLDTAQRVILTPKLVLAYP